MRTKDGVLPTTGKVEYVMTSDTKKGLKDNFIEDDSSQDEDNDSCQPPQISMEDFFMRWANLGRNATTKSNSNK
jgi:hypothetical protein